MTREPVPAQLDVQRAEIDTSGHLPYAMHWSMVKWAHPMARQKQVPRTRAERLEARISPYQKTLFQRAAALQGRSLTDFVVSSVQEAAVRTIEEMEIIRLTARDSHAFADALLHPRAPNEKLRAAARRYLETIGS